MQKILVIEDERAVLTNIVELLQAEGFNAIAAEDGFVGLQLAQVYLPDLIVCDVMMPGLDGYSVLEALRQNPSTAIIPFIFLTAKAEKADLRQGMELGADDYLTKPFTITELLRAIDTRLKRQALVIQMQQKIQDLQQLNELKDDFFNTASHDLRVPLTNIKMAIQLLKMANTEEQRNRYLNLLQTECDRETELLNDLLDWQRLEANAYPIAFDLVRVEDWLPSLIEPFSSRIHDRQQTLEVNFSADTPPLISDQVNLRRVLAELLNNACKYTPSGKTIIFTISFAPYCSEITQKSSSFIIFTISNQVEIPATELPLIFKKFYRIPNPDVSQQCGTGLGLSIVEKLVQRLQGTIEVESANGWTTFTVQLPVKPKA